ncbi:hypothetical protein GGX14DRAFT_677636 [Mycena pura]|uniref:Uncharacterized protein n=1 Tax=Mycena pura TaxID=153505 RepID=A0AAD6UU37_9AGAR|nr:hypothetical protein GGX14DRAFT_677636 [Mycena pura]
MCLGILWICGHKCWQYNPDLAIIFPSSEETYSIPQYRQCFLSAANQAITTTDANVSSVSEFDGPLRTAQAGFEMWGPCDNPQEDLAITVGGYGQSVRGLVGTRHFDVCHTMKCWREAEPGPGITDILVLAELSAAQDRTRAVFPATLFLALAALFEGTVTSRRKSAPLVDNVTEAAKNAVVDVFHARRQLMEEQIALRAPFLYS